MDKQRNALKKSLKVIGESSLRRLCSVAMLTETETAILAGSYSRMQDERFIADSLCMSVGGLQKKKKLALKKILFTLGIYNPSCYVPEDEIVSKLGTLLSQ